MSCVPLCCDPTLLRRSRSEKFREEWVKIPGTESGNLRTAITLAVLPGAHGFGGIEMNWDQIEGNWKEAKGKIKQKWGQLTDDDLARIASAHAMEMS